MDQVAVLEAARALLRARGAGEMPHPGGTLLAHLERTRETLARWGNEPDVWLAGLCHAMYGTQGFPHMLLPLEQRATLRAIIGEQSEGLVYAYCSFDRSYRLVPSEQPAIRDRFIATERQPPERLWRALAELTAANELDVLQHAELTAQQRAGIVALLRGCDTLLSPNAHAAVWAYIP